jgi:hypothetical protein
MIEQQTIIAEKGILYVAYGDNARAQVRTSMQTVKKFTRKLSIAVVSNTPLMAADKNIYHEEADKGARTQKTQMYRLSPFEQTLYLDADTEMLSSPDAGFALLKYVDLVLCQDITRNFADDKWKYHNKEEVATTIQEIGVAQHMYYNSGVIFFRRNEHVVAMMDAWYEEWQRWGIHDQMALLRAIHRCPVRIAPMRSPWNTHHRNVAQFIFHKHHQARQEGAPR